MAGLVHGVLVALMVLMLHGFVDVARHLGWRLARVRAGTIAYGTGVVCMLVAALGNGFVMPGLAEIYADRADTELDALDPLFMLCHLLGHSFARAGVVAMSSAIASWSSVMLGRGALARALGAFGLLVAGLTVIGIFTGRLHLDVFGMGLVIVAQAEWTVGVAVWLRRPSSR